MTSGPLRLALVALLAPLAACSSATNTIAVTSQPRPPSDQILSERVVIENAALGRTLKYGEVVARKSGLVLQAQVAIENVSSSGVSFEYRWEWTDAEGFQLGDTLSNWQPAVVNGGERKLLTGVGPGPAAANFRLYLRPAGG